MTSRALREIHRLFSVGTVAGLPDEQLLARFAAARDEASFEALVTRYGAMVLAVCRGVLKDEHAAEDVFQATFLILARKAGSLWARDSLGGWLHRVAYRLAVRASIDADRRHRREGAAVAMSTVVNRSSGAGPDGDWLAILHEEIDRLPEVHRAPIVLCHLQELTYEQAARQLRWTVPTLRCRLARARQRLRVRLARQGVASAGAVLVACLDARAETTVPPACVRAAVDAAIGAGASPVASALVVRWLRGVFLARLKTAAIAAPLAVAIVVAAAGIPAKREGQALHLRRGPNPSIALAQAKSDDTPPIPREQSETKTDADERVEFRGIVLGPRGKPFDGATITLNYPPGGSVFKGSHLTARMIHARSGSDGWFRFAIARSLFPGNARDEPWRYAPVVASAEGFGPDWTSLDRVGPGTELTLRLVEDDIPIAGRVLDLQGRPIAKATVNLDRIQATTQGTLNPFFDAWNRGDTNARDLLNKGLHEPAMAGLPPEILTEADGRFRLRGIGRDRIVRLRIAGTDIEQAIIDVMTRATVGRKSLVPGGPGVGMQDGHVTGQGPPLYGPEFDFLASPGRVINGTVRDRATGKPLEGVRLNGSGEGDGHWQDVEAVSDAQGRYRLVGMAVAARCQLRTYREEYLPALKYAPADEGLAPITVDFDLPRGIIVRGKVTDRATGKPASGLVVYQPLAGNTFYRDNPGGDWFQHVLSGEPIRKDGSYEALVGPGPGAILVQIQDHPRRTSGPTPRYLPARRHPNDGAPGSGSQEDLLTGVDNHAIFLPLYQAFGVIDPKVDGGGVTCDLQVVPALKRPGKVVGPDGQPLPGATVAGLLGRFDEPRILPSADFTAEALDPTRFHYLLAIHRARKLAGTCVVSGGATEPIVLELKPWATIVGRLVDADGLPHEGVRGNVGYRPEDGTFMVNNSGSLHGEGITTDREGRFRFDGLIPGLSASLHFSSHGSPLMPNDLIERLKLRPGELRDLGDLTTLHEPAP